MAKPRDKKTTEGHGDAPSPLGYTSVQRVTICTNLPEHQRGKIWFPRRSRSWGGWAEPCWEPAGRCDPSPPLPVGGGPWCRVLLRAPPGRQFSAVLRQRPSSGQKSASSAPGGFGYAEHRAWLIPAPRARSSRSRWWRACLYIATGILSFRDVALSSTRRKCPTLRSFWKRWPVGWRHLLELCVTSIHLGLGTVSGSWRSCRVESSMWLVAGKPSRNWSEWLKSNLAFIPNLNISIADPSPLLLPPLISRCSKTDWKKVFVTENTAKELQRWTVEQLQFSSVTQWHLPDTAVETEKQSFNPQDMLHQHGVMDVLCWGTSVCVCDGWC